MLYVRMLFSMLVSLYTSRVVLQALGIEDFGIYGVVGGLVAMFAIISSTLSSSISRFIAFELGTGNADNLRQVFATSLVIQLSLIVVIVIAAETVGLWFLSTQMVIPPGRVAAAHWAYQASVAAFAFSLFSCPYNAAIIAHERMGAFAAIGIVEVLLRLGVALTIAFLPLPADRLICFSLLSLAVAFSLQAIYVVYCRRHFPESHTPPRLYRRQWKEMSGFAGWNAIGCTAGVLKDQGINVMLNIFFGPVVNAARAISTSVATICVSFSSNFMMAVTPQITKSYAAGDNAYTFSLVERGSRFSFYILLTLAIPLLLDVPYLLQLWLGEFPPVAIIFTRLTIIVTLIDILSNTLINLQCSTGRIRNYQLAVGGMLLLNFPLSYLMFHLGMPPQATYVVAICIAVACLMLRLLFLRSMVALDIVGFLRRVCLNVLKVAFFASLIPILVWMAMPESFLRLLSISAASLLCSSLSILYIGCSASERDFLLSKIIRVKTGIIAAFR